MSNPTLIVLPGRQSRVLSGIAVDKGDTFYREDCYWCDQRDPKEIIFRVMAAIPPTSKVLDAPLQEALTRQLATGKISNLPKFFQKNDRKRFTFNLGARCEALVAEYRVSDGKLVSETVYIASVRIKEQQTYEEYSKTLKARQHMEIVTAMLASKPHLLHRLESEFAQEMMRTDGISAHLIYSAIGLFNHTCRHVARNNKIPFIGISEKEKGSAFRISKGYASFNRGFRDPGALANILNLVYFLSNGRILFEESELLLRLPK